MNPSKIRHTTSAIFGLYVPTKFERLHTKLREIWAKVNQNLSKFLVTTTRKTVWAIILKLSSVIHLSLKVDRFELLMNWSNIVCFMIDKGTQCKIYITHIMINGTCIEPCALTSIDFNWNLSSTSTIKRVLTNETRWWSLVHHFAFHVANQVSNFYKSAFI